MPRPFELGLNIQSVFAIIGVVTTIGILFAGGFYIYLAEGLSQGIAHKHFWE